jgi:hypothetical protein
MSENVEVSISITKKQAGKLYMDHMRRGRIIKNLRHGLNEIIALCEAEAPANSLAWQIATKAKAAIERKDTEHADPV